MDEDIKVKIFDIISDLMENDLRFCQIITNVFDELASDSNDPFYVEDDKFLEVLESYSKS